MREDAKPIRHSDRDRPLTGWGGPLARALGHDAGRARPKPTLATVKWLTGDDDEPGFPQETARHR
jgi:hypothetical protein